MNERKYTGRLGGVGGSQTKAMVKSRLEAARVAMNEAQQELAKAHYEQTGTKLPDSPYSDAAIGARKATWSEWLYYKTPVGRGYWLD